MFYVLFLKWDRGFGPLWCSDLPKLTRNPIISVFRQDWLEWWYFFQARSSKYLKKCNSLKKWLKWPKNNQLASFTKGYFKSLWRCKTHTYLTHKLLICRRTNNKGLQRSTNLRLTYDYNQIWVFTIGSFEYFSGPARHNVKNHFTNE